MDSTSISSDDPEVRGEVAVNTVIINDAPNATNNISDEDPQNAVNQLITHFSSWKRLKISVAWFLQLRKTLQLLSQKRKEIQASLSSSGLDPTQQKNKEEEDMKRFRATMGGHVLFPEDIDAAESVIIQYCQMDKYSDEITALKKGTSAVKKSSHIYKLDPVLKQGILRVGGRLSKGAMPEDTKHPVILAKDQHIATFMNS